VRTGRYEYLSVELLTWRQMLKGITGCTDDQIEEGLKQSAGLLAPFEDTQTESDKLTREGKKEGRTAMRDPLGRFFRATCTAPDRPALSATPRRCGPAPTGGSCGRSQHPSAHTHITPHDHSNKQTICTYSYAHLHPSSSYQQMCADVLWPAFTLPIPSLSWHRSSIMPGMSVSLCVVSSVSA